MKIIFSPSKKQNIENLAKQTKPLFFKKSQNILDQLSSMTQKEIKEKLKVSESLAEQIYSDYLKPEFGNAISSYSGTSFSRLNSKDWTKESQNFAQQHLFILSAVYGALRPFDQIQAHRLDVADKALSIDLYEFWREDIDKLFDNEDLIINLASKEYSTMVLNGYTGRIIEIDFLVQKNDSLKTVSVLAKQQRGSMLNYVIEHMITDIEKLKNYSSDGFIFSKKHSAQDHLIFVKQSD